MGKKSIFDVKICGMSIITKQACKRLAVFWGILLILFCWGCCTMIAMPGKSFKGKLAELSEPEKMLKDELSMHVKKMAGEIGERNVVQSKQLTACADYIEQVLKESGYEVKRQKYTVDGCEVCNIEAQIKGKTKPDEILVVGAHYDTVYGCPGANDNTSGAAGVLVLAKYFSGRQIDRTIRFVLFVNEEPPYFQTEKMGSFVYAKECRDKKENIIGMISLETIGFYSDAKNSQKYPFPFSLFYPSTGNFIGFVSNVSSSDFLKKVVKIFRQNCQFPSEAGAMPAAIPGVGWSDQWSFWQFGYPALMVTDTAPFRYRYYHQPEDTPDKLDFERMAKVTAGIEKVVEDLAKVK